MKTLYVLFAGITTLVLFSCNEKKNTADASGVFETTEVIVSSESSGKILELDVSEGQVLEAGQNVGYIDSMQIYLKKMQLLANVKQVQSRKPDVTKQIAAIEQQIATAKTEKQRVENLLKASAATQKQLDDANAQLLVLEKQLDAQKSTLSITTTGISEESSGLQIQVAQLDDQLKKCRIVNPINGAVLGKYAEQSEVTSVGKALYKIANVDDMFLRAYVTSAQLTQLKIDQKVQVSADFGTSERRPYSGIITWISSKAEFTPKTIQTRDERANLVYAVKVAVKNDGYLKIGMYGDMTLGTK